MLSIKIYFIYLLRKALVSVGHSCTLTLTGYFWTSQPSGLRMLALGECFEQDTWVQPVLSLKIF